MYVNGLHKLHAERVQIMGLSSAIVSLRAVYVITSRGVRSLGVGKLPKAKGIYCQDGLMAPSIL
jgi:hypothetical protein